MKILEKSVEGTVIKVSELELYSLILALYSHTETNGSQQMANVNNPLIEILESGVYDANE